MSGRPNFSNLLTQTQLKRPVAATAVLAAMLPERAATRLSCHARDEHLPLRSLSPNMNFDYLEMNLILYTLIFLGVYLVGKNTNRSHH